MNEPHPSILPPGIRPWIVAMIIALTIAASALWLWRGPALLLDLAALSGGWICF